MVVRDKIQLKLVRCLELPSADLEDIAAVLVPTFVYIEDNLGRSAEKLLLCGFGAATNEAEMPLRRGIGLWKWKRCARRSARPGRITRDCWGICGPSPGIIEAELK